jgi:hypothetical protein
MKDDLEKFIQHNRERLDTKTPPPEMLGRILGQMQPEEEPAEKGILIPFRVLKWSAAAAVLLFASVFAFRALQKTQDNTVADNHTVVKTSPVKPKTDTVIKATTEIAQIQPATPKNVDAVDKDIAARKKALLARMKERSLHSEKQVIFAGLNDMESPAARINATSQVYKLRDAGNDVIDVLVETLNTDPSANVRLAALDGLSHFYKESYVRKKLIASLRKQQDPLVQIAMINLLTRMKESGVLSELEKMVHDDNTQPAVKDCAYSGIIQLKSS